MPHANETSHGTTRRHFCKQAAFGLGAAAMTSMLYGQLSGGNVIAPSSEAIFLHPPHFAAKAKSVIFLFMAGGPSQLELFDFKPKLVELSGRRCPQAFTRDERIAFTHGCPRLLGTRRKFSKYGKSGQEISDLLPHLATIADDIAIVRTMRTAQFNHAPAQLVMNTGFHLMGRPSLGSWLSYGLGSDNKNLPGFAVLHSGQHHPDGGKSCWSAGFLPAEHQGVEFRDGGAKPGKPSFASNCLLARRLVESGVRFVQLYHRGWDSHGTHAGDSITDSLPRLCRQIDQPAVALINDLKQRGLLDQTLVIWGGEFGRSPIGEARNGGNFPGRDHHPHCFSMWMAGGGIRPGITLGQTDELGFQITEDPVDVHDLHAAVLHLMGVDHKRLIYKFQGRELRLADGNGEVVRKLLG
jgi:hypothetical protein